MLPTKSFCSLLLLIATSSAGLIDLAQDAQDAANLPLLEGFFRTEVQVLRLENPRGISHTGLPCDITGGCDTHLTGILDTEKPNHDFGGDSAPYRNWNILFEGNDMNSPNVNQGLGRDNCNKPIRKIHVRLRAIDKDTLNDDKIDNFSFYITGKGPVGFPAESKNQAKWSGEEFAIGQDKKELKVALRYRWYKIPEAECHSIKTSGIPFIDGMFS